MVGASSPKAVGPWRAAGQAADLAGRAACKNGGCCAGGILDCASVVVLVTRQRRAAGERLLAVGIGALVRPLAGVDTAMACKGAGVAKGLATALALVRFFTGVDTAVDGQGRSLDELFSAAGELADMGAHAGMDAF